MLSTFQRAKGDCKNSRWAIYFRHWPRSKIHIKESMAPTTNFKKVDWEMLLLRKQINGRQVSIASHFEANEGHLTLTLATSVFKCLLPGNDFQFESNLFEIRKKPLVIVSKD
jgi:hypothetical protein